MQEDQLMGGDTESGDEQNQESNNSNSNKAFSQEELDRIVAERVARERKKFEKRFDGVDVDHYRKLTEAENRSKLEVAQTRQEFEQLLQDTVGRKEQTIQQLQKELQAVKVDGRLLDAASRNRAVNPQQVVKLLKENVRLAEDGDVEILDEGGKVRYSDKGTQYTVEDLVSEWLDKNPHFVQATPAGSGSQSQRGGKGAAGIDIGSLDMSKPADRKLYKEYLAQRQH